MSLGSVASEENFHQRHQNDGQGGWGIPIESTMEGVQDSANIKTGIEHDYVTNELKGVDETHSIATLSKMFQSLAQQVKDTSNELGEDEEEPTSAAKKARPQNSILNELPSNGL